MNVVQRGKFELWTTLRICGWIFLVRHTGGPFVFVFGILLICKVGIWSRQTITPATELKTTGTMYDNSVLD